MNTPEEKQYIRDNSNWWDRFSMNLIYVPVASGLGAVSIGILMSGIKRVDYELTLTFLAWWAPIAVLCVILNIRGARKIAKLLIKFRNR